MASENQANRHLFDTIVTSKKTLWKFGFQGIINYLPNLRMWPKFDEVSVWNKFNLCQQVTTLQCSSCSHNKQNHQQWSNYHLTEVEKSYCNEQLNLVRLFTGLVFFEPPSESSAELAKSKRIVSTSSHRHAEQQRDNQSMSFLMWNTSQMKMQKLFHQNALHRKINKGSWFLNLNTLILTIITSSSIMPRDHTSAFALEANTGDESQFSIKLLSPSNMVESTDLRQHRTSGARYLGTL